MITIAMKQAGVELSRRAPSFTSALRERGAGCHEGEKYGASDKAARQKGIDPRKYRAEDGGESWHDVEARASDFLKSLLEEFGSRNATADTRVLLVAHGAPRRFVGPRTACCGFLPTSPARTPSCRST